MLKRYYAIVSLLVALSIGIVSVQRAESQSDKQKEKEKVEAKEKRSSEESPSAFTFALGQGEGSYLGVYLEEVTPERVKELGLREERGALIMKIVQGGPAQKAGLKENDIIVSFNGRRVDSVRELQRLMSETPAGRNVPIEIVRGGSQQTFTATLSKRSHETQFFGPEGLWGREKMRVTPPEFGNFTLINPRGFGSFHGTRLGISVESLTEQLGEYFGVKSGQGVLITEVYENGAGAKAGLKAGDVITAVDNQKINNVNDLVTSVSSKEEGTLTLTIVRNRGEQTVNVTVEKREQRTRPRRRAMAVTEIGSIA